MRQGWQIRESDSVLVATEPVRGIPVAAPPMHAWRPHPLIEPEARSQFLIRKSDQAVFTAMNAVEIRIRQLAGLGEDLYGIDLMNKAFGQSGPLADPPRGAKHTTTAPVPVRRHDGVFRNPVGHREVNLR
jgi:hypothetical protein